ncbi:patatin-like phospholipase domain-containing protein 2 isoform X1 [Epinephelus fuscoguttatus]|uniref:patatin-like phospholipase domain-containing protein 2 isoform X1 n=1 Tax=Epinephelus fuscoguttatus TaxID=293821 RepID=UPI0020D01A98|nr:patatin-like phospholipase domain-containing protein 2 isoform X1 [Epinephelus fuscoguttatus]
METSEKMSNWDEEWNISFAGCGFRSIYYLGALSCILERAPRLVHGASKICGASSGCLVAAALTVGIPIEEFCVDVLAVAKEARKHTLGVFHPTFSLLRTVRDSLLERLPADAHLRASGKLCVSLTRLSDGRNVLVSEFDSREELIQVLMCSCFFPVYCGFVPPSYRGVLYMDGALSNNMPLFEHRNTITMAPFSGESDICPREGTFNFFEVHYGNVSIQVNTGNVHRVCTSFLPPTLEKLAEICHNGYMDALHFLKERDLLGTQCLPPSVTAEMDIVKPACCELAKKVKSQNTGLNGQNSHQEDHCWLSPEVIENLPVSFKKVLCEACRDSHGGNTRWSQLTKFPPVKVVLCLLTLLMLPIELSFLLIKSIILSLLTLTADLCRQTWKSGGKDLNSTFSRSSHSDLRSQTGENINIKPLTSTITRNSKRTLHWDNNGNLALLSLTSTCTGPSSFPSPNTPAYSKVTLNHRSKRTLHQTSTGQKKACLELQM